MGMEEFVDVILDEFRRGCKPLSKLNLHGTRLFGMSGLRRGGANIAMLQE
jgi:hypothetical protein